MTMMHYKGYEALVEFDEEAEKPYSSQFVVRVEPGLHRAVVSAARGASVSLNKWVARTLEQSTT